MCYRICGGCYVLFFFFKQKTAYEMRISDWSSDVCSSDLGSVATPNAEVPIPRILMIAIESLVIETPGTKNCRSSTLEIPFAVSASPEFGRASCRERVCQYV